MKYNAVPDKGVELQFEGVEVDAVRKAFGENIERLQNLGNDGSISSWDRWIANWSSNAQSLTLHNRDLLMDPLRYFVEATEEKVDEQLDASPAVNRFERAAKRYELGWHAGQILAKFEEHSSS
jgi:hypothetical protein